MRRSSYEWLQALRATPSQAPVVAYLAALEQHFGYWQPEMRK